MSYIYTSNEKKENIEIITTFSLSTSQYKYIVYKCNDDYYAAKYQGDGVVNLETDFDDLEIQLFNAIMRTYYQETVLKKNRHHTKIDLNNVNSKKSKIIKLISSGVLLTISAFLLKTKLPDFQNDYKFLNSQSIEQPIDYEIPNDDSIISFYFYDENNQMYSKSNITKEEYPFVKYVSINLSDDTDLSFLKNFKNLDKVKIIVNGYEKTLRTIREDTFSKPIELSLIPHSGYDTFPSFLTDTYYDFLKDIKCISRLTLGERGSTYVVNNDYLSSLRNVEKLDIYLSWDSNFDAKKYDYLDELNISGDPYDIPISVSKKDIKYLEKKVNLKIDNRAVVDEINDRIESIASTLNVNSNSSDKEKLNAILRYILFKYNYPEKRDPNKNYYEGGFLYASLNGDDQICGNYAAMATALSKYLDLKLDFAVSYTHAWNIIKLDNKYFYVDPTFIDEEYVDGVEMTYKMIDSSGSEVDVTQPLKVPAEVVFTTDDTEKMDELEWYLKDINGVNDVDHFTINIPNDYYSYKNYKNTEKIIDLSDKKYEVNIDGTTLVVDSLMLLTILTMTGHALYLGASALKKEKIKLK